MIQGILFNSGRTLYDSEKQTLFPGTEKTLQILSKLYSLIIVSLVSDESIEKTLQILCRCGIEKYFAGVYFDQKSKEKLYTLALTHLKLEAREVAIIDDDRIMQGIQWGNSCGATTIWLKRSMFVEEPNEEIEKPTHTISNLEELCMLRLHE